MMPNHANDNIANSSIANDSIVTVRTIEPFHRLWVSELLHKTRVMNDELYYVGEKYRRSFADAGGNYSSQPPAYTKPVRRVNDEYKGVPTVLVDKCLPYYEAAKVLDALEIREVVEAIVVHSRPLVGVGKVYSGYTTDNHARCAAITALRLGLFALKNHYDATKMKMAS
jgi:hypothetical protein